MFVTLKNQGIGEKPPKSSSLFHQNFKLAVREIPHKFHHSRNAKICIFFFFLESQRVTTSKSFRAGDVYHLTQLPDCAAKGHKVRKKKMLQAPQTFAQLSGGCSRHAGRPVTRLSRSIQPSFIARLGRKALGFKNHRRQNIGPFKLFGVLVFPGGSPFCWQTA